jgi:hypothetical protein
MDRLTDRRLPAGVTRRWQRCARGNRWQRAAKIARSAQSMRGRGLVRRSTATSWRSTRSSTPLADDVRTASRTSPSTCQKIKYSNRNDTTGSCLPSDIAGQRPSPSSGTPHPPRTHCDPHLPPPADLGRGRRHDRPSGLRTIDQPTPWPRPRHPPQSEPAHAWTRWGRRSGGCRSEQQHADHGRVLLPAMSTGISTGRAAVGASAWPREAQRGQSWSGALLVVRPSSMR